MARRLKMSYGPRIQRGVRWFPVVFFFFCTLGILGLLRISQSRETRQLRLETEITSQQVKHRLEAWIDSRTAVVSLFARIHAADATRNEAFFVQRAESYLALYPGFQALNFIDTDYVIRIICPVEGNQAALGRDLHLHPSPGVPEAIAQARQSGAIVRTPLIDLLQGGPGFATYCPVTTPDGTLAGYINGVFSVQGLVEGCLSEEALPQRFRIGVYAADDQIAYESPGAADEEWPPGYTVTLPIRIVDKTNWQLKMALQPRILAHAHVGPDEVLALGGTVLALMLSMLLRAYLLRIAELRTSRESYRLLFENAADMVLKIDVRGAIEFSSPSTWLFLGLGEEDVLGRGLPDFAPPEEKARIAAALKEALAGTGLSSFEVRLHSAQGLRTTSWSGSPLRGAGGRIEGLVAVGRDITAHRELESQLLHSQKLQAVGQLAGGIAHDFNNLIHAIQGYLEFALTDLPPDSPSREDLKQAGLATERASRLTRQLLAFSSRQIIQAVRLDLHAVVHDISPMLKTMLGDAVLLEFELAADHPVTLADQGQIQQILMNLCVNARDAMAGGGLITVGTRNAEFGEDYCAEHPWARPGRWVQLDVTDTGHGIPAEIQDKVFEPFFTTKAPGHGTGLGLATVYGIVKQHAGLVRIQSRPGAGTTFSVYFKQESAGADPAAPARVSPAVRGRETLLLVEDQAMVRELAVRILQKEGYQVLQADDGLQAVEMYEKHRDRIAMTILDLVLPSLDGRAVCDRIRAHDPAARVLFISGFDPETAAGGKAPQLPADLLAKPFTKEELLQRIRQALDRKAIG